VNGSQARGVGKVGRQCTDSASASWREGRLPEFFLRFCLLPSPWPDPRLPSGESVAVEGEVAVDLRMVDRESGRGDAGLERGEGVRRQPRLKLYVRPRWILLVLLGPFIVLGLLVVLIKAYGLIQYDPAYFTADYLDEYRTSGDVARALETALQTGDQALLAELEGLRWPEELESSPSIVFVMLWERSDRYVTYLYFDMEAYERHPHHVEFVDGRYVVAPEDLHYLLYSGQWRRAFVPLAILWWIHGIIILGLVWAFRASERMRACLYAE
jgi:hypothetical protein